MKGIVLDCSVVMAWIFPDETDVLADCLLSDLGEFDAIAPSILPWEVANVSWVALKRQRFTQQHLIQFVQKLRTYPIRIEPSLSIDEVERIVSLSTNLGIAAYDAAYLDLAMRKGFALATLDKLLSTAAQKMGVQTYAP